jgi:hypothetical protein
LGEATKIAKKRQRESLFKADIKTLTDKLAEFAREASPLDPKTNKEKIEKARAESKKHLEAWLKDRGLTPTGTKGLIDEYSVVNDPDLKPLNAVAKAEPDGTNSLSELLFSMIDPRTAFGLSGAPFAQTPPFRPRWFPDEPIGEKLEKPNFFVWVSEEVEEKPYLTLENANRITNGEMTKRVDRAWKLEKARALAKAEADRLAEQVRNIAKSIGSNREGVERQLRDLAAERKLRIIELENLALLKRQPGATQATQAYEPPKIERDQVLYPTPNFADQLLELRKQPLGGVAVLNDTPRSKFYVACEIARDEKTVEQFREVFVKTNASGAANDPLFGHVLSEHRQRAIEEVRLRLRADAKLDEKEAFKSREKKEGE